MLREIKAAVEKFGSRYPKTATTLAGGLLVGGVLGSLDEYRIRGLQQRNAELNNTVNAELNNTVNASVGDGFNRTQEIIERLMQTRRAQLAQQSNTQG